LEAQDLLLRQLEPRKARDVEDMLSGYRHPCILPRRRAPFRGPTSVPKGKSLDRDDVRRLQALLALHDLEFDSLALGQRLVPVHRDRREVNEHVLPLLPLDESVALLVREPLHGALSQRSLLQTTRNDDSGTESSR